MQFKLIVATIAASAVSGVLAAPGPNNHIAAREQNARMAEMTQLSDLAKQEGLLANQIHTKFGATFQEQVAKNYENQDTKMPTMDDILALKAHMKAQTQKRDAAPEADPEAWGISGVFDFDWGCGWQSQWPYLQYPDVWDWNPCNYYTAWSYYNPVYSYPGNYWW